MLLSDEFVCTSVREGASRAHYNDSDTLNVAV
jgi:hypothetical protein